MRLRLTTIAVLTLSWSIPSGCAMQRTSSPRPVPVSSTEAPTADECQRFVDKSWPLLPMIAPTKATREQLLTGCRSREAQGKSIPLAACVVRARDDDQVKACYTAAVELWNAVSIDAIAQPAFMVRELDRLKRAVQAAFDRDRRFVLGHAAPTPATDCCAQPGHRCRIAEQDWRGVWAELGFRIDVEPFGFQLRYASDGSTFTAAAVGDPACNGDEITYVIAGRIEAGNAVMSGPAKP